MIIKKTYLYFIFLVTVLFSFVHDLHSFHAYSKYFPILENDYSIALYKNRKNSFSIDCMYAVASTAFKRGGGSGGIPELYGKYNLSDVINSLVEVQRDRVGFINPVQRVTGSMEFADRPMLFRVDEKINAQGLSFSYIKWFFDHSWFVGAWIPFFQIDGFSRYKFNRKDFVDALGRLLTPDESSRLDDTIDSIRRTAHDVIGFKRNDWSDSGFGDLDVYFGYNYFLDHQFLMRSINIMPKLGLVFPTGLRRKIDNPSSVPIMSNNHWGIYSELHALFELKQDLRVGFISSVLYQFSQRHVERIPVYKEPGIYSSLRGRLYRRPGVTLQLSSYLVLENLADGLNFQAKYTYLRHAADSVKDVRDNRTIASYLTKRPNGNITKEDIEANIAEKRNLTKWRSHYITLQLVYNSRQALTNWRMEPNLYVNYDIPFGGNGISKTHMIAIGVTLHF